MKRNQMLLFVIAAIFMFSSCKRHAAKEQERNEESMDKLKVELHEVGQTIDSIATEKSEDFQTSAQKVLDDFNNKLDRYEKEADKTKNKLSAKTQESIDSLKMEMNQFQTKLDSLRNVSQNNWEKFSEEVREDFKKFGNSVKKVFGGES